MNCLIGDVCLKYRELWGELNKQRVNAKKWKKVYWAWGTTARLFKSHADKEDGWVRGKSTLNVQIQSYSKIQCKNTFRANYWRRSNLQACNDFR